MEVGILCLKTGLAHNAGLCPAHEVIITQAPAALCRLELYPGFDNAISNQRIPFEKGIDTCCCSFEMFLRLPFFVCVC